MNLSNQLSRVLLWMKVCLQVVLNEVKKDIVLFTIFKYSPYSPLIVRKQELAQAVQGLESVISGGRGR
jgi:hypothetical protein